MKNSDTGGSVELLADSRRVATILPALRRRILASLSTAPDSATGLASRLGMSRQKLNYHLRRLESAGLVSCVEERRRRGFVERCYRTTARAFLISSEVLGRLNADPEKVRDRFSSAYLMAAFSRVVADVGAMRDAAAAADQSLVTLTMQTDVSFASPRELSRFSRDLADRIADLIEKYHSPDAPGARSYRFVLGGHPARRRTGSDPHTEDTA